MRALRIPQAGRCAILGELKAQRAHGVVAEIIASQVDPLQRLIRFAIFLAIGLEYLPR